MHYPCFNFLLLIKQGMIRHLFLPGIGLIFYSIVITILPKMLALIFVHNICAEFMNLLNVLSFPKLTYDSVGVLVY